MFKRTSAQCYLHRCSWNAPYTFSYTINGGPVQTITTVAGNSITLAVPTAIAGTFTYALVSVRDASSTVCSQAQTGSAIVTVNPLPTATISGTDHCMSEFSFRILHLREQQQRLPYTFSYRINGGPVLTATTVAGNSVTVPVSTATIGTYTYTLISVQDGSSTACSQAQAGSATVVVNPLPTASIAALLLFVRMRHRPILHLPVPAQLLLIHLYIPSMADPIKP